MEIEKERLFGRSKITLKNVIQLFFVYTFELKKYNFNLICKTLKTVAMKLELSVEFLALS